MIRKTIMTFATLFPFLLWATTPIQNTNNTTSKNLAIYHTVKGNIENQYNILVEKKLKSIGFRLTDSHKRMNDQYKTKWGTTVLDVLSIMPIVKDSAILPLLNIDPRIAGFSPFNLIMHKKLDENVSYVGHLVPDVMLDILGIENKEVRSKFISTFKALDATIAQELGGHESIIPYKALPEKTMMTFAYTFDASKDMHASIDTFQNTFELAFIDKGYLITGFHNFMESTPHATEILSNYDAFWTYSIDHLEFSYNIFDNKGARPEAALFAPYTMYMYIPKGSNRLVAGMFRLQNWSTALDIRNEKRVSLIEKLDTQIPQILTKLGMKEIDNANPLAKKTTTKTQNKKVTITTKTKTLILTEKDTHQQLAPQEKTVTTKVKSNSTSTQNKTQNIKVGDHIVRISIPKVPEVKKCASSTDSVTTDRSIKFSKRIPPNYKPHSFDKQQKEKIPTHTRIGEVNKGKISAYLRGSFMKVAKVEETLKAAGFDIIGSVPVNKDGSLISIVFTDKSLVSMASKPNKGFMASLRVLVDTKEKTISITNPLYMTKGFLQDTYDDKASKKILSRLLDKFPNLTNSKDALKFQLLDKYQFMNGMPKYQNMVEVASGDSFLEKIKNNKRVLFTQTLENGSTLIGIQLSKRTNKFTKKIGRNNAAMLPYPILIENGKAKILDPKFYISYMYPKLTMSEFMTIATIPDAIIKDCQRVFKNKR